jgi:hypothetical protein
MHLVEFAENSAEIGLGLPDRHVLIDRALALAPRLEPQEARHRRALLAFDSERRQDLDVLLVDRREVERESVAQIDLGVHGGAVDRAAEAPGVHVERAADLLDPQLGQREQVIALVGALDQLGPVLLDLERVCGLGLLAVQMAEVVEIHYVFGELRDVTPRSRNGAIVRHRRAAHKWA